MATSRLEATRAEAANRVTWFAARAAPVPHGRGALFVTDPKAIEQGFNAARLSALAPLHTTLFDCEGQIHAAETTRTAATRTRALAYKALNTKCSGYCARGYDHLLEIDQQKAHLFVRTPASHAAPAVMPPVPPTA